ncbi:MAG: Rpn family recombination-promoting nuclease/putative transposase [Oscillospiraceae bacterium]|nr:Rpn family recombination-promoting nuclease/putative transposase [Oscillospiraceae bacterium]
MPYGGEGGAEQPVQRTRDVIKSVTAMTDRKTAYLILAIENQANIHYAMPVRNLVYDALQYAAQVEKAIASHGKSGGWRGVGGDKYLSKFLKEDRLMPALTLVVYFGPKVWDGPLSIHEMFQKQDEKVLALVPDYRINLLSPAAIADEDFEKFKTTLREVLSFIKYSSDADKLSQV